MAPDELKIFPLYEGLDDASLKHIALSLPSKVIIPKGTTILKQDAISSDIYFIFDGILDIQVRQGSVNEARSGTVLGEFAILKRGGIRRTATVIASTDVVCVTVDVNEFLAMLEKDKDLHIQILENLGIMLEDRCQTMNYNIRNLMY